jgi:hypothetical protein
MNPSGTTAPVTSLSPVVTDHDGLERSRARLTEMRARKRKIAIGVAAAAAVAVVATGLIAPRSLDDAQQMAKRMFSGEREDTRVAAVGRPEGETSTDTSASTNTGARPGASAATSTGAGTSMDAPQPSPAATQPVPTQPVYTPPAQTAKALEAEPAPAPIAKDAAGAKDAPAAKDGPVPKVNALLDQVNQRGGKLTDAQLTAAVEKLSPKLDQCYATALEKKPRLKGRLIVGFTIKQNGKAAAAKKQGGTIKDADLTRCTLDAILGTKFPRPKKQAAQVRLPFEYKK